MKDQITSLISFYVNKEVFAFDTLKVRNILEFGKITWVPNTKDYILGVMNLHGNIFPVADLRVMMATEHIENTADTSIIVVSSDGKNDSLIGIVVDGVKEVFDIDGLEINESVYHGNSGFVNSFLGTIHKNEEFVHIIDLDETVMEIEN
ncbi:chemotaxis protein CheW [Carboxylicivirga caseinilyticus]|uniref:chemotaxis protein CheW n=1 Tax=Carboxylicivirga caseinilyticus TaxID=3417572 RepID=UPI003D34DC62|nr:purine-binding chemotaxis protein CheW [Marinilabiliaceae bacterium A049]